MPRVTPTMTPEEEARWAEALEGGLLFVMARDPRVPSWDEYQPIERSCPMCGESFIWSAMQQWARTRNVASGHIVFTDAEPSCSQSCARSQAALLKRQQAVRA